MNQIEFEWDENKNINNQVKHGISFEKAQYAFADKHRIIAENLEHSFLEKRYYCFGMVDHEIVTVRFIY